MKPIFFILALGACSLVSAQENQTPLSRLPYLQNQSALQIAPVAPARVNAAVASPLIAEQLLPNGNKLAAHNPGSMPCIIPKPEFNNMPNPGLGIRIEGWKPGAIPNPATPPALPLVPDQKN